MAARREMAAVLVVVVDGHRLAFPLEDVVEVRRAVAVEPLPGAPDLVQGVINVRGEPVPLLDLRRRFGRPSRGIRASDQLVLLDAAQRRVGVVVDRSERLRSLAGAVTRPVMQISTGADDGVEVAGVSDGVLVVLDLDRFLTADELRGLDEALAAVRQGAP